MSEQLSLSYIESQNDSMEYLRLLHHWRISVLQHLQREAKIPGDFDWSAIEPRLSAALSLLQEVQLMIEGHRSDLLRNNDLFFEDASLGRELRKQISSSASFREELVHNVLSSSLLNRRAGENS